VKDPVGIAKLLLEAKSGTEPISPRSRGCACVATTKMSHLHMNGLMQRSDAARVSMIYSIPSSAMASGVGGTVRPSSLAVWVFMTNSNLLACTTGKSASYWPTLSRSRRS
jgi:hypothetical protein